MSEETETLYNRIGGEAVVNGMVDEFYARVLADSELRPFFENTSVERLTKMQKAFFAAAMDGPVLTSDVDLAAIHAGRKIKRKHLTRYVKHLISVLEKHEAISSHDAMDIIFRVATYSDQIIGESGGADG